MDDNRAGRSELLDLLALSGSVDRFTVPPGPNAEIFQVLGTFAGRSRRLARSVLLLLDEGHDLEAGMLERVLMETVVTLQWRGLDWDAHIAAWRLADAVERLRWDDNYAKSHSGERVMSAEGRAQIEAVRVRMTARGAGAYPEFWQRCKEVEQRAGLTPTWNALLYRRASHGAIHPSVMAVERLIDHIAACGCALSAPRRVLAHRTSRVSAGAVVKSRCPSTGCSRKPSDTPPSPRTSRAGWRDPPGQRASVVDGHRPKGGARRQRSESRCR